MATIKVLLSGRPKLLSDVIRNLIERQLDMEIISEVIDPLQLLIIAKNTKADAVIITPLKANGEPNICRQLLLEHPHLIIITLEAKTDVAYLYRLNLPRERLQGPSELTILNILRDHTVPESDLNEKADPKKVRNQALHKHKGLKGAFKRMSLINVDKTMNHMEVVMKTMKCFLIGNTRRLGVALSVGLALLLVSPATTMAQTLEVVNLGAAGDFAILAGSLVSNVPTSAVTGNIGLSPASGSNITGFGGAEVTGTIYTVDATGPAGSVTAAEMLTDAKGDLTIAYNDAAGRTPTPTGPYLNPGAGDIGGLTLISGLYKFTSDLSITGSDVTLTGSETDVWIFQIASSLVVGNGIQVILAGGALPANIFWQVGTSATLGTTCAFKGTILADQSISLSTGATLDGQALASSGAVTIEASTVTTPGLVTSLDNEIVPSSFALAQNYPNPFNPATVINYQLPSTSNVTLSVFDVSGREVSLLVSGVQNAGNYQVEWDARHYSSGIYIYRLEAGASVAMKQMLLIK